MKLADLVTKKSWGRAPWEATLGPITVKHRTRDGAITELLTQLCDRAEQTEGSYLPAYVQGVDYAGNPAPWIIYRAPSADGGAHQWYYLAPGRCAGTGYHQTRQAADWAARRDLAQVAHSTPLPVLGESLAVRVDGMQYIAPDDREGLSQHRVWVEWQDRYREAKSRGMDDQGARTLADRGAVPHAPGF